MLQGYATINAFAHGQCGGRRANWCSSSVRQTTFELHRLPLGRSHKHDFIVRAATAVDVAEAAWSSKEVSVMRLLTLLGGPPSPPALSSRGPA